MLWHNVRMPDEHSFTLQQIDGARTDYALIESNLESIVKQLSRAPTRGDLAWAALGIMVGSAAIVILWAEAFWRL
jgi:hypothetical protein